MLKWLTVSVGVLVLNERHQLTTVRPATEDCDRIVPAVVFDSLRTNEIRNILSQHNVDVPQVPNTQERRILLEYFLQLTPRQVHDAMVKSLRKTRCQASLSNLMESVPSSLRAVVFSTALRKQDHSTLVSTLNVPMQNVLAWA